MNKIIQIYHKLLEMYGPQGWWPIINNDTLICEYGMGAPRNEAEALEICIGAILTQNTAWKNVEKAIINLNKNKLMSIKKIKKINKNELAKLIRPSGYYNQKAERLKIVSEFLLKNPINKLKKENTGLLRKRLLEIKGIGPETADSILLYAFNKPMFVIDAYTKRIFGRLGYKEKSYEELQTLFMCNLPKESRLFNEYHALLVELGKNYCKKKPNCEKCPIATVCRKDLNII